MNHGAVARKTKRRIIEVRCKRDDRGVCSICLDPLQNRTLVHLPCGHPMHLKCEKAMRASPECVSHNRCPVCRQVIDPEWKPRTLHEAIVLLVDLLDEVAGPEVLAESVHSLVDVAVPEVLAESVHSLVDVAAAEAAAEVAAEVVAEATAEAVAEAVLR